MTYLPAHFGATMKITATAPTIKSKTSTSTSIISNIERERDSKMARKRSFTTKLFFSLLSFIAFGAVLPVFAPLPSLSSTSHHSHNKKTDGPKFEIANDKFWKDGQPFQIIGGDVHYFRVLPEYWEDRLLRAKALGLNTIQTYVPWNLHEPKPGQNVFDGIADLMSFLKLCKKLDLLVMLRIGPYICAEWDFGGLPPWLLNLKPAPKLRASDPTFNKLVERWWGVLLPRVIALLYSNGGPVVMVQVENEFGSYGDDKTYLNFLVKLARTHLGNDIILYTTDGGTRETLQKGTVGRVDVFSAVDFQTGSDPWPIFQLQKKFNPQGKSPPLSAEFYTGWLTHWGNELATTDAYRTAAELEKILSRNGSAVLYMAHGGTNFGFYNGANTGQEETDYQPDLTSYDYDAPITEAGDSDSAKYGAIRRVIERYTVGPLPRVPENNVKIGYGQIVLQRETLLFDLLNMMNPLDVVEATSPLSMESVGQMFGFLLYASEYAAKDQAATLLIPKVHDRGQVFISCPSHENRPIYVGIIERWSNKKLELPATECASKITLYILVENMGRVNYGKYLFDPKGILSPVYLNGRALQGWKMYSIPLHNLNEVLEFNPIIQVRHSGSISSRGKSHKKSAQSVKEPGLYSGSFYIHEVDQVKDTFLSFPDLGKGIAYVNDFNIGRYWPSLGPQCNLYVPAPVLRPGKNTVVVFELESSEPELTLYSVDKPDFTCRPTQSSVHQL